MANKDCVKNLRDHLLNWGVLVPKRKNYPISKALEDVLDEEDPAAWPQDRLQAQLDSGTFYSNQFKIHAGLMKPFVQHTRHPQNQNQARIPVQGRPLGAPLLTSPTPSAPRLSHTIP